MKLNVLRKIAIAVVLSSACALTACKDYVGKEESHALFQKGESCKNQRKYAEAVKAYNEFLLICPKSAKTHYKLAEIYKDNLGDPIIAIYHFQKYQEL